MEGTSGSTLSVCAITLLLPQRDAWGQNTKNPSSLERRCPASTVTLDSVGVDVQDANCCASRPNGLPILWPAATRGALGVSRSMFRLKRLRVSMCAHHGTTLRVLLGVLVALGPSGCRPSGPPVIAVIPRTSGTMLWEPVANGAQVAASKLNMRIYWNASTREDDVDGQIALVERVTAGPYRGLVLAPNHTLALLTPVRRALARGLITVVLRTMKRKEGAWRRSAWRC